MVFQMSYKDRLNKIRDVPSDPAETVVRMMKYFGWTIEDMKKLSVPSFIELAKQISKIEDPKKNGDNRRKVKGNS